MKRRTRTLVILGVMALVSSAATGSWMNALGDMHQLSFCSAPHQPAPQSRPAQHRAISSASAPHFSPQPASFASSCATISDPSSTHAVAIAPAWHPDGARRLSLIATLRI